MTVHVEDFVFLSQSRHRQKKRKDPLRMKELRLHNAISVKRQVEFQRVLIVLVENVE